MDIKELWKKDILEDIQSELKLINSNIESLNKTMEQCIERFDGVARKAESKSETTAEKKTSASKTSKPKIAYLAVLSSTEEFYEELKKPHFIRKRQDGFMAETGEKKTFLETTANPTLPKAMMFLKDVLREKIEKTNKGEPVELINIGKACSRFITEYTQEFKLNTPEYKALDDEFYDVV